NEVEEFGHADRSERNSYDGLLVTQGLEDSSLPLARGDERHGEASGLDQLGESLNVLPDVELSPNRGEERPRPGAVVNSNPGEANPAAVGVEVEIEKRKAGREGELLTKFPPLVRRDAVVRVRGRAAEGKGAVDGDKLQRAERFACIDVLGCGLRAEHEVD